MNVLIIRPGALGDTLMLMPAIAQLQSQIEILLVGRYPGIDYLKAYVSQYFNYEAHGWHMLFSDTFNKVDMPYIPKVDYVVGFLSDPEKRAAYNLKIWFPDTPIYLFPPFPPEDENIHVALYIARLLQKAGLPIEVEKAIEEARKHPLFQQKTPSSKREHIVLHPGSGSQKKNYSPEFWIELIRALKGSSSKKNTPVVLLLGPAEEKLLSYYENNLGELGVNLSFYPDQEKLLSLMSQASLYIGHDSGITHLAAMMGINVIALFKESSIEQWHPLGPAVRVLQGEEGVDVIEKIIEYRISNAE